MIRKDQEMARRAEAPCHECGHAHSEHRELGHEWTLVDGEIVEKMREGHAPGLFYCHHEGCTCRVAT
jgi:hypothetical protein